MTEVEKTALILRDAFELALKKGIDSSFTKDELRELVLYRNPIEHINSDEFDSLFDKVAPNAMAVLKDNDLITGFSFKFLQQLNTP